MEVRFNFNKQGSKSQYKVPSNNYTITSRANTQPKPVVSQSTKNKLTSPHIQGITALNELDALVGLNEVKLLIKELRAYVLVQKARTKEKLTNESMVLHMVFKGNPFIIPVKLKYETKSWLF